MSEEAHIRHMKAKRWIADHLDKIDPRRDFDEQGNLIAPKFLKSLGKRRLNDTDRLDWIISQLLDAGCRNDLRAAIDEAIWRDE